MKKRITLLNVCASMLMQLTSIISALIVPRLILETFGSNANGLISSISQFLNYIALVEGGITGVISANLYEPLVTGDNDKLSSVLSTAKSFYRKIAVFFIGYSIIIGIVYPIIVDTGYDTLYVFVLTEVLSIGLMLEYMFSLTYTTLLKADKKIYFISIVSSMLTIANIILTLAVVKTYPDIILLKFANAILFALKPLAFGLYIKRNYRINWHAKKENALIKQRWNGFAINLAFFIHISTDVTLLTLFNNLSSVSVYSVYYLVVSKVSVILQSISTGIDPTIGQAYARNDEVQLNEKMDLYEFVILVSVGVIFTLTGLLITPFVMIYTKGIGDANYYQPVFASVLVIAEGAYLLRTPHISLAYSANKFKEITIPAYIEAVINIVLSIFLMKKIGIVGIAVGTLVGMLYRGAFHIYFTSRLLPSRSQWRYYKKLVILVLTVITCVGGCLILYPFSFYSVGNWIIHAIVYATIICLIFIAVCFVFFKNEIEVLKKYLKKE